MDTKSKINAHRFIDLLTADQMAELTDETTSEMVMFGLTTTEGFIIIGFDENKVIITHQDEKFGHLDTVFPSVDETLIQALWNCNPTFDKEY
jgi:hypothetical protein